MRIFVIGFGGAGSRIADTIYEQDRHFSKLSCVEAIAVDRDPMTLNGLRHLPVEKKVFFPSLSQNTDDISDDITIDEVLTMVHRHDTGDRDAIIICGGAGGTMIDAALDVIPKIRSTMAEPVFGLFTLPVREEGRKVSAKAAFDIERLAPLLDGIILFDNEIWSEQATMEPYGRRRGQPRSDTASGSAIKPLREKIEIYRTANEGIGRRLGLLLRAGEFSESGGVEIGEVVLDAGEILNTIRGMGFIAIGYSAANLRDDRFSIHRILRPSDYLVETGHKRASRLVDIAKEAIYENISIPCDMTSARKALILVAGPSHEISMKGYMTVRKWIDRSIAGMEVRSGDYPVKTTKYIAIIVILAGVTNIPRISEINSIRTEYTKEYPEWISDLYRPSATPVVMDKKPGDISRTRELLVPRILSKKLPHSGHDAKSGPEKTQETRESVRTIPFFGRHGTSQRQGKESPALPDDQTGIRSSSTDTSTTTTALLKTSPEKELPISENITAKDETSVARMPEYASHEISDDHTTNLANIVAKARKDLEKIDER